MGMGSWDANSVRSYAEYSSVAKKTTSARELFKARELKSTLSPEGVSLRESCDSDINPESTAIMIALDVTGSMGEIARLIASEGLGVLMNQIMERKPVSDPHIMFLGVGDVNAYDRAPLQLSQFEPDIRIVEQLNELFVEGGGGGNDTESYDLPWYVAATRTSIDCFEKRGKKGYLFTIGDEMPPSGLTLSQARSLFGTSQIDDIIFAESANGRDRLTGEQILELAQEKYHIFHLVIEQGFYAKRNKGRVLSAWQELLGKRAMPVDNYERVCEVILSAMDVSEGGDVEEVITSWMNEDVQNTVRRALGA